MTVGQADCDKDIELMRASADSSSLASEAYAVVRERILRGELAMGQIISRRKLAAELGMSFLPVSEALLRLEIEGLLESRPRAGTRVRIPTQQDVQGHYVVREALEIQAARLFSAFATAEERTELMKLAARVDALSVQSDRFLYLGLHEKLHRRIAECARCPALSEAIEKTHALASTWFCVTRAPSSDKLPRRHQDLMKVLVKKDADSAAEAMRNHVMRSMENTMQRLQPYFKLRKACGKTFARSEKRQNKHLLASTRIN